MSAGERVGLIQRLRFWLAVRRVRNSEAYFEAGRLFGLALHRGESPEQAADTVRGVLWAVPEPMLTFIVGDILGRYMERRGIS